jgi:hypothetical protein
MFLRAKVTFPRKQDRKGEVLSGENETVTQFQPVKVRILRGKVRFLRAIFENVKANASLKRAAEN